jgi:hypothetical protein
MQIDEFLTEGLHLGVVAFGLKLYRAKRFAECLHGVRLRLNAIGERPALEIGERSVSACILRGLRIGLGLAVRLRIGLRLRGNWRGCGF